MNGPRMSVNEVIKDMREKGMSISPKSFNSGVDAGVFPFAKFLGVSELTGRRAYLIMRKDYEQWSKEYLNV